MLVILAGQENVSLFTEPKRLGFANNSVQNQRNPTRNPPAQIRMYPGGGCWQFESEFTLVRALPRLQCHG